ncbi:MAG TPA: sugar ABC transporter permease [Firmicutes bacterium]|nr:sugar ABC transporter permease [Bacillota bacterium]
MESVWRNKKTIMLFVMPALLLYGVIIFVPVLLVFYYSLFSWDILNPPRFIGLRNYIRMFSFDYVFPIGLKNTVSIWLICLVIQQSLGLLLSVILTSKIRARNFFKNVFFMPSVISSVAIGLMWSFVYHPTIGIVNTVLRLLGLEHLTRAWLLDSKTALWAIALTICWQYTGSTMVLFIASIQTIPRSIFEAARIDGASFFPLLWHITLPLLKPILKVNTILISVGSLKLFDLVHVMTGGGPAHSTQVLASYTYARSFQQFEYGYGASLSVILLVLCLLVTLVIQKIFPKEDIEY